MKKAAILLFFFAVVSFIFANIASDFSDLPVSVLVQKHNKNQLISWQRTEILKEQKISGEFKASEDNLGILAFRFVNPYGGGNSDKLIFRLKEKGKENWHYENTYATDQFQSDTLFPLGFPPISSSHGKTYYFEITIKVLPDTGRINNILIEELDSGNKLRRWESGEDGGIALLALVDKRGGLYYLHINEKVHDMARLNIKIQFSDDKCYLEKIL